MIEIRRKGNLIMPLTRWAVNELINEDIIDDIDAAIGCWYEMDESGEFMLAQCKFEGKIEVIQNTHK